MIGVVTSPFVSLRGIVVRTNVPRQPRARLAINPVSQDPVVSYDYCTFIANRLTIDGSGYNCLSTSNCNTHQNLAQSEHRGTMLRFLILIVRGILIDLTRRKKRAFFLRVCVSLAAIASFLRHKFKGAFAGRAVRARPDSLRREFQLQNFQSCSAATWARARGRWDTRWW